MTTVDALRAGLRTPGGPAVVWVPLDGPQVSLTFQALLDAATRLANVLLAQMTAGEAVGVQAASSDVWLMFQHAAALAGIPLESAGAVTNGMSRS